LGQAAPGFEINQLEADFPPVPIMSVNPVDCRPRTRDFYCPFYLKNTTLARYIRAMDKFAVSGMFSRFLSQFTDIRATTAIEYALIAAVIAVAANAGMGAVGTSMLTTFSTIARTLCRTDETASEHAHCVWLVQNLAPGD
jgi:Flp pilus assembly pilin Flp